MPRRVSRRGFLAGGSAAAAATALVPTTALAGLYEQVGQSEALRTVLSPPAATSSVIPKASLIKELLPGLNAMFGEAYESLEPSFDRQATVKDEGSP